MKKSIPCIVGLSMLCLSALAQIPKGTSTIGGSISGSYQESDFMGSRYKFKETNFDVQPNYGYFVIDNLAIGATVGASLGRSGSDVKTTDGQKLDTERRSLSVGPNVSYYLPISEKLYAHAMAGYVWRWTKNTNENYSTALVDGGHIVTEYTGKSGAWSAGAGLSYFLTPNAALTATLAYTRERQPPSTYRQNPSGYVPPLQKTGSLSLGIGIQFFLRKTT